MRYRPIVFASLCFLANPVAAQNRAQSQHATRGAGMAAPQVFRGGARGPVGWDAFHHDTAPARVTPHRFEGTNLASPNRWRGNARNFDLRLWQSGTWRHVTHGGSLGWWWVIGPNWYFFDAPVYPYPDLYTPLGEPIGWWYWCDPYQDYYPYVTYCPVPWESVMPQN